MNENEWMASKDPPAMIKVLIGKVSDRKLRLFAVAACRRVAAHLQEHGIDLLGAEDNGTILEAVEQGADTILGEVGMSLTAMQSGLCLARPAQTVPCSTAREAQVVPAPPRQ
jgi:hypothetical protein